MTYLAGSIVDVFNKNEPVFNQIQNQVVNQCISTASNVAQTFAKNVPLTVAEKLSVESSVDAAMDKPFLKLVAAAGLVLAGVALYHACKYPYNAATKMIVGTATQPVPVNNQSSLANSREITVHFKDGTSIKMNATDGAGIKDLGGRQISHIVLN